MEVEVLSVPEALPEAESEKPSIATFPFEGYAVVGLSATSLEVLTPVEAQSCVPELLYCYPPLSTCRKGIKEKLEAAKDFCFPKGVLVSSIPVHKQSDVLKSILYPRKVDERNSDTFVFVLAGYTEAEQEGASLSYFVCSKFVEAIQTPKGHLYSAEKVHCFLTQGECFGLLFYELDMISRHNKKERMQLMSRDSQAAQSDMQKRLLNEVQISQRMPPCCPEAERYLEQCRKSPLEPGQKPPPPWQMQSSTVPQSIILTPTEQTDVATAFFCATLFSALSATELFTLIYHLSCEHSILFISRDLNVLTSASLGALKLLAPFRWPHTFCPILPSLNYDLLEAPVPFVMGLNEELVNGMTYIGHEWAQTTYIVLLDAHRAVVSWQNEDPLNRPLPSFEGVLDAILPFYSKFYPPEGPTRTCYQPSAEQREAVAAICRLLKNAFKKAILAHIPEVLPILAEGLVDLEAVKQVVKRAAHPEDADFIEHFLDTQMFANYIDDHDLPGTCH